MRNITIEISTNKKSLILYSYHWEQNSLKVRMCERETYYKQIFRNLSIENGFYDLSSPLSKQRFTLDVYSALRNLPPHKFYTCKKT